MPKKSRGDKDGPKYKRVTFVHDGQRYERKGKTPAEAHAKAAELKEALKRGEAVISGEMTVRKWAEDWLETYKRPSIGEGHYGNYRAHIFGAIIPEIGFLQMKDVKDVHLQKLLNGRAGKSKSDLTRLRATLKAMFGRAHLSRLIAFNPAANLCLPAAEDGTHRSITEEERVMILDMAETHHGGLWVKTLLFAGIRPGESRALDWRHIDFKKKLIYIEQAMKANSTNIGPPKSKAGVRMIPISDELFPALLAARGMPLAPVFTQVTTGKRHTKASMEGMWNNFKREMDIRAGAEVYRSEIIKSVLADDLTAYCLRHTYCTDLQDAGVPINVAKYLMGHSDISTTARIYTHTTDRAIEDAAQKINSFAKSKNEKKGVKSE